MADQDKETASGGALSRVRKRRKRLDSARSEFVDAVMAARAEGVALRTIAAEANLSHTGIAKIVKRAEQDRATPPETETRPLAADPFNM